MKIGILTFHRTLNYGAVLQCYALKEFLKERGHNVEVIDYRPECIEKERWAFYKRSFKKKGLAQKLKYLCLFPFSYFFKKKAVYTFDGFLNRNFSFSNTVNCTSDIPDYYDVIVFGSDQIWSPILCNGFNPIYYGDFPKGKTRFVSYAASLEGYMNFSLKQWEHIANCMKNFDSISVREYSFCKELSKHIGQPVHWVVDPTLLVPSSFIKKLANKQSVGERYVFLFTVQKGDLAYRVAKKIARERNTIIVRLRGTQRLNVLHGENNVKTIYSLSPEDFVGLINGAECVVTNSFHATAISLQLGKNFYSVKSEYSNRVESLLSSVDLNNRYVSTLEGFKDEKDIDYDIVRPQLDLLSSKSREFLISNIEK